MANVKGLSVSGELIADAKDKTFFVCASPHYELVSDLGNSEKTKEKLIVPVHLSDTRDGSQMDYYPNKTSIKMMTTQYGFDMDDWIGHKFEWGIADQNVSGHMKKVLFVLPKRFNDVLPIEQN